MGYFANNYHAIRYPVSEEGQPGLRKAQIGAIHSIASHFTISKKPGIVIMPTGTGKTAVLMMCPFVLKSNRVLIITPSKLVRDQITKGVIALQPLRNIGVLNIPANEIRVKELKNKVANPRGWAELGNFNVVVSTPNCISPDIEGVTMSDPGFFDLILIDEAHHTPAKSWIGILNHYVEAKKILFTATPFRRDKKEIPGKIIYNYPISHAYADGIFGQTEFIPVNAEVGDDVAIARECERIFRSEPAGILHYVMVRTDSKKRATELFQIYNNNTRLRLHMIHSGLTSKTVENTLNNLRSGTLDGIICVDMLGEGFDFPNLKIAAIHSPHKSLAATLQFIGRFTRTNANNVTHAKFLAIPAEVEIEKHYLYRTNSVWRQLIIEMSEDKIDAEISSREMMDGFQLNNDDTIEEFEELSLNSIEPSFHVKIYAINQGEFQCDATIDMEVHGLSIVHREENTEENISVLILQDLGFPKWSKSNTLKNVDNHLVIVYFDVESSLLFINSTIKKSIDFYEFILHSYCIDANGVLLSDRELNSVLANISEAEFFNIGMRNRSHYSTNESYRIVTGQTAHLSIDQQDADNFHRGHLVGKGVEDGGKVTIGLSSSSKVWSHRNGNLHLFITWAKEIAYKINEGLDGRTNTPIDDLPTSVSLDSLPNKEVVVVNWHESAFKNFTRVVYDNGEEQAFIELTDIQLVFNHHDSDNAHYRIALQCDYFSLPILFSYNYEKYFTSENEEISNQITVYQSTSDRGLGIIDYLNVRPLIFYFSDFSMLYNSYHYLDGPRNRQLFPSDYLDDSISWEENNVNIENECNGDTSIHYYLKERIANNHLPFSYYDHGSGEVADFITAEMNADEILIKLYHCKGSTARNPGNRVEDIYEVMGQGVKSLNYTNFSRLVEKIQKRQKGKTLNGPCNDKISILQDLIANNRGIKVGFQIILVQPGITKNAIQERISYLLAAANSTIRSTNNCRNLMVITST